MEKTTNTQTQKRTHRRSPRALLYHLLPSYEDRQKLMLPHLHPAPKAHKMWRRNTQRYKINDMRGRGN